MYLGTHAVPRPCLKYAGSLLNGEETPVAEYIYIIGQPLSSNSRYHLIYYQVNITAAVVTVLCRHGMRPQKGGSDSERRLLLYPSDNTAS
jgi:hypothetical protein